MATRGLPANVSPQSISIQLLPTRPCAQRERQLCGKFERASDRPQLAVLSSSRLWKAGVRQIMFFLSVVIVAQARPAGGLQLRGEAFFL